MQGMSHYLGFAKIDPFYEIQTAQKDSKTHTMGRCDNKKVWL